MILLDLMLPGMDISESTQRVYPKQTLAAQVIGYIGKIPSRTMWLTLQAKGYSYNDTIGRDGIESSMEDWLTQNSYLCLGCCVVVCASSNATTGRKSCVKSPTQSRRMATTSS